MDRRVAAWWPTGWPVGLFDEDVFLGTSPYGAVESGLVTPTSPPDEHEFEQPRGAVPDHSACR
jgi:hypothetical protein